LLFCNGSGTTLQVVRPLLDSFAGKFDLLAWDYRGLGRSVPLAGPYAMADLAADAAGLLEMAARVERLALACTSAGGGGGSSYPVQDLQGLAPEEQVAAELKLADDRWDAGWLETHPADRSLAEGLTAAQDHQDPAAAAAYTAQIHARAGHDVWDRLDVITCRTLIGYGNYDGIAPAQNSTAIASRIRGAQLRGYAGGHLFLFQDPAALPEFEAFLQAPSS
jgi:pimeloyl-ACP methyl ester carboxylesterase